MKSIFSFIVALGLALPADAGSNVLGSYSQMLSTSKTVEEFVKKALAKNSYLMNDMLEHAKSNNITRIPKSTYENGILTLALEDNSKMTLEATNHKTGDFKINGKPFQTLPRDTIVTLSQRLEKILNPKTSFFQNLFLPEAHATPLHIVIGGIVIFGGVALAVYNDFNHIACDEFAKYFANKINGDKEFGGAIVEKIERCDFGGAIVNLRDKKNKTQISYAPAGKGSQGTITETIESLTDGKQVIVYDIKEKGNGINEPDICSGVTVNGNPADLSSFQTRFARYSNMGINMIRNVKEQCSVCKREEVTGMTQEFKTFENKVLSREYKENRLKKNAQ